jgi:cation diffusion facilitator family transporter
MTDADAERAAAQRDRGVLRVLWIEGSANAAVLVAKLVVALSTGSSAVLSDAVHSLADLANNGIAMLASRVASSPPDREHPYGHRKFETLAVFVLATLLAVLAVELALHALRPSEREVERNDWGLWLMLVVLVVNVAVSRWESLWARRLDSDLLRADARHTLSDVLVTIAVIAGWQLAALGHAWGDSVVTLLVAGVVLYLAFGLYSRAIPVLVDRSATDPDELSAVARGVAGVRATRRVRSRGTGPDRSIDLVVMVDPELSTLDSHAIADEIERTLRERFAAREVIVHVEPADDHS